MINRSNPASEQDIQIAQYLLGLLGPEESRLVQDALNGDPAAARRALQWEAAFLDLIDALPPCPPPRHLLNQVLDTLDLPHPLDEEPSEPDKALPSVAAQPARNPAAPAQVEPSPPLRATSAQLEPSPPLRATSAHLKHSSPLRATSAHLKHSSPLQAGSAPTAKAPKSELKTSTPELGASTPEPRPSDHAHAARPEHMPPETPKPRALRPDPALTSRTKSTQANATAHTPTPTPGVRARSKSRIYMGGAGVVLASLAVLALVMMPRSPAEPPVVVVEISPKKGAILQAPGQSSTPGWVVTIDPENNVSMTPQVVTETPADTSVQLWTYNKTQPTPRSLGLIDPNQLVIVPADVMREIGEDQFFEMTLEPSGGAPGAEPTGPVLFIGRVVTFE